MHTVMWTFKLPTGTSKSQLIETIKATAHTYEGIPGLIRKHLSLGKCGRRQRILHRRLDRDGNQALGSATAASGLGNTDGRGERRATTCCSRIATGSYLQTHRPAGP